MNVLMPQLGETVAEGTVAAWHKSAGDRVAADEILLDVETDKVSMEIPAPKAGTLKEILVQAGETVDVGTVLAVIQGDGEEDVEIAARPSAAEAEPVTAGAAATAATDSPPEKKNATARNDQMRLSPAVRRLVAEYDLDIHAIDGSGRNGRITRRDVIDYIDSGPSVTAHVSRPVTEAEPAPAPKAASAPTPSARRETAPPAAPAAREPAAAPALSAGRIPFNRIRKLTADHMVKSKATSPHVLQAVEVDFSNVDKVRKALRDSFKAENGYSLTYLPFIAHAVCRALSEFPNANASVEGDTLVLHDHVNLAIAVDLGADGLVAPVIRAAEALSITELAGAINDIARRARSGALRPDDLSGGTYTLSNSGTFGTLITAPIINQPQVAILSTDGVRKKPVVIEHPDGDSIGIRPIGILAQSFDHRAIDGAYSAAFLDRTRKLLETTNWFRQL